MESKLKIRTLYKNYVEVFGLPEKELEKLENFKIRQNKRIENEYKLSLKKQEIQNEINSKKYIFNNIDINFGY